MLSEVPLPTCSTRATAFCRLRRKYESGLAAYLESNIHAGQDLGSTGDTLQEPGHVVFKYPTSHIRPLLTFLSLISTISLCIDAHQLRLAELHTPD